MQQIEKTVSFVFGGIPATVYCSFDAKTALEASIEIELQFNGRPIPHADRHLWDRFKTEAERGFNCTKLLDHLREEFDRRTNGEGYDDDGQGKGVIQSYVSIGDAGFEATEYGQKDAWGEWHETDFEVLQPKTPEFVLFDDADRWLFKTESGCYSLLQTAFAALSGIPTIS